MVSADSFELRNYGINAGLTNYAAAYCAGLLCARRLLVLKGMDKMFPGNDKVDGKMYSSADHAEERRPFKALLDVGLAATTTGNRVFGAMKGACDGGLHIPHSDKRFPGMHVEREKAEVNKRGKKETKDKLIQNFNAKEHREHIFGIHV